MLDARSRIDAQPGAVTTMHLHAFCTAAIQRPQRVDLVEDAVAEHVAGAGESEGRVGMETLEALRRVRATDPEVERCAPVLAVRVASELTSNPPLLLRRPHERGAEVGALRNAPAPALYAACRLERAIAATRCGHVR